MGNVETGTGKDGGGDRDRHGIEDQADHVVQGDDLQQRFDKITLCSGLPDRHDRGGRRRGGGQRAEDHGKGKVQAEDEVAGQEHQNRRTDGFQHSDRNDFAAVLPQRREAEEFAGAERDKSQGDIRQEGGSFDDFLRDQVQAVRSRQDPADDIGCDIRQAQLLCDAGHQESAGQHQRDRDDRDRNAGLVIQPVHPQGHESASFPGKPSSGISHRSCGRVRPGYRSDGGRRC